MCELHGDKGLAWEASDSPGLIINLNPGQLHINLSLNKMPLIVIQWNRGAQGRIKYAIPNHEYKHEIVGGWEKIE